MSIDGKHVRPTQKNDNEDNLFIVGRNFLLKGDIVGEGTLALFGKVDGNIQVDSVIVNKNGIVTGDISCQKLDVTGVVLGAIKAEAVVARAGARIEGKLQYSTISMEAGAIVRGQLEQGSDFLQEKDKSTNATLSSSIFIQFPTEIKNYLLNLTTFDKAVLKTKEGEIVKNWVSLSPDRGGLLLNRLLCVEMAKKNEWINVLQLEHEQTLFEIQLPEFALILGSL